MTREEALSQLLAAARLAGVPAAEAIALWEQESSFSTDLNLPHQELSGGRGHAVGPFGIVPYYHPNADLSSFQSQARYALNYLKKVGHKRYYGTGKPPPGFPTPDDYVRQFQAKARHYQPSEPKPPLQAATMFDYAMPPPPPPPPGAPPNATQPNPAAFLGPPMVADRPLDPVQRLMNNPLTHIGLGILATPTGQGSWLQGVARGTMAGMQSFQAQQQLQAEIEDTIEKQRQRAYRKQMEDMRLRIAATMPGLSDLERNLLITDPDAFGQIYAAKMAQQQQQQARESYNQALGIGPPGTATAPAAPLSMAPPPAAGEVTPGAPPVEPTPGAGLSPGEIPLNPAALAPVDPARAIDIQRELNRQEFERQQEELRAQREAERNAREEQERIAAEGRAQEAARPEKSFNQESSLRKEYRDTPEVTNWSKMQQVVRAGPKLYERAMTENSKVADMGLLMGVGKAWDPGSVVMEGERIAIARSGGLIDEIAGYINYFNNEGRLTPEMRDDLLKTIQVYGDSQREAAKARQDEYIGHAQRYGFDPARIVGPLIELPTPTAPTVRPGAGAAPLPPGATDAGMTPEGLRRVEIPTGGF